MKQTFLILVYGALVSTLFAEKQPFDRYQSIVDRQMFGPLPPGFDPTARPSEVSKTNQKELTKEQEKIQSAIHFSVINVDPNGDVYVGFTDKSNQKSPRNYFLKVGESRDGWTVKEADAETATMMIVKDDIEVKLSLGGSSSGQANATTKIMTLDMPPESAGALNKSKGGSLRQRRMLRRQQDDAAAAKREAERKARYEAEKAEREAERDEMRQQLMTIQEDLRREREAKFAERQNQQNQEATSAAESETHDEN